MLALLVGFVLALAIGAFATTLGLDRDRAFYPTVTIVIAAYYVLFAVMGASSETLVMESFVAVAFIAAAATGFKWSLWIVAIALAAHGVFDLFHGAFIHNPGVPAWWPGFCAAYDLTASCYLAWLLKSSRLAK